MKNIKDRVKFWSEADEGRTVGGSLSDPFKSHIEIFESKDVLEIGPGWGRQFEQLNLLASTYCVADICQKVLGRYVYKDTEKFLIQNYQQDFNTQFDVITFWYVIHHVLGNELEDFFDFIDRHLHVGGSIFFNCPNDDFKTYRDGSEDINGDGIKTTPHSIENIKNILEEHNFQILYEKNIAPNCYVLLAEKAGGSI